jgi:nitrogen-specific signal transduction histidine kinase
MTGYLLSFSSLIEMVYKGNYHGISDKVRSLIEEMLFMKNQKYSERTTSNSHEVMARRNVMTKPDYVLQK